MTGITTRTTRRKPNLPGTKLAVIVSDATLRIKMHEDPRSMTDVFCAGYRAFQDTTDIKSQRVGENTLVFIDSKAISSHRLETGIFYRPSTLYSLFPRLEGCEEGADVTQHLELKNPTRRRKSMQQLQMHCGVPYPSRCYLSFSDCMLLAPYYAQFTDNQKEFFFVFFLDIDGLDFEVWTKADTPILRKMVDFLDFCLDLLVNVECAKNIRRHFTDPGLKRLWQKLRSFTNFLQPSFKAISSISNIPPRDSLVAIVGARNHAADLSWILKIISTAKIVVVPVLDIPEHKLVEAFYSTLLPPCIKRVVYACLAFKNIRCSDPHAPILECKGKTVAFRSLRIFMEPTLTFENSQPVIMDRESKCILYPNILRKLISYNINPYSILASHFDVFVSQEPGRGPSVFEEVLKTVWSNAIDNRTFVFNRDTGFNVSPDVKMRYMDDVFTLGFLSGLCVRRGFYLPFPLSPDLWDYIYCTEDPIPYRDLFSNYAEFLGMIKDMSDKEVAATLWITEEVVQSSGREKLIEQRTVPNKRLLGEFKRGWCVFGNTVDLSSFKGSEINAVFCEPTTSTQVTQEGFEAVFINSCAKDQLFLKFAQTLDQPQLVRLVEFITGKTRLPFPHIGEHMVGVQWVNEKKPLPLAQNCTNTLILPNDDELSISSFMKPVFEFDSIFGFL
jgi:hypothetical protein